MTKQLSLVLALLLLLPGCGKIKDEATTQTCEIMVRVMWACTSECIEDESLFKWYFYDETHRAGTVVTGGDESYCSGAEIDSLLSGFYELEGLEWYDAAIVRMEGVRAFELAVLSVPEEEQDTVVKAWQEYLLDRQGAFTGYEPAQAALVGEGKILTCGQEVALLICENVPEAQDAFESCYGDGRFASGTPDFLLPLPEMLPNGRYVYTDPGIDDMTLFDNSPILAAWENGDDSALSEKDRQVLDAAKKVLSEQIAPNMSDCDKEFALYAWLTGNAVYDQSHYEKQGAPRTSYEPYGPLIEGTGVCLGFATAFQLLMDMAGIECITVTGAAFRSRENHAWNMVRLDGEWYCVDPTWDLNPGINQDGEKVYSFFNVNSDWLATTDHQWDYDSVPEATANDHEWHWKS